MWRALVRLVIALAPRLRGLDWGVGGSTLLWRLGLVEEPRDLDLVTTSASFPEMRRRLTQQLGPDVGVSHPTYRSRCFACFGTAGDVAVDLFADVVVLREDHESQWSFDPRRVEGEDGIPRMQAADWLVLYALFDRPQRVAQLQRYFSGGAAGIC